MVFSPLMNPNNMLTGGGCPRVSLRIFVSDSPRNDGDVISVLQK